MTFSGQIAKMRTTRADTVHYQLPVGTQTVDMNALLGQDITLSYAGEIHCVECGRRTSKSFNQGYCYPCFKSLAQCDSCIVKPEQCHYFHGTCREPAWGEQHCLQDHYVYLANSSGLKAGITRGSQIPTRWMDQGATQALPIFRVSNRLVSGLVEMALKQHVADKTAWQRMLKGEPEPLDLAGQRDRLYELCAREVQNIQASHGADAVMRLEGEQPAEFLYPVNEYPAKVKALNFDKTPEIKGRLNGIKGQYLILDSGVLNIRKFSGYNIRLTL